MAGAMAINVVGITKKAGRKKLLEDVFIAVLPGEFVGVLGPSGSGKSTLLRSIIGLSRPNKGQVLIDELDLYKNMDKFRSVIGYVPQDDIVHASLSVRAALTYAAKLRMPLETTDKGIKDRVKEVIKMMELGEQEKLKIRRLSGGQRKRVSIGVELLCKPPLLFLDEPTSGLDPALEERMMTLFRSLSREGLTVLVTTHVMSSVDKFDLIAIVYKGNLIYYGPPGSALVFFSVENFHEIYTKIEENEPIRWANLYRRTIFYQQYIELRLDNKIEAVK